MKSTILTLALLSTALSLSGCDKIVDLVRDKPAVIVSHAKVYSTADPFGHSFGASKLTRTHGGIKYELSTTDLQPGHAYTLWLVIFNEPEKCMSPTPESMCGDPDVVNEAAKPDIVYAAGLVIGGSGEATFRGHRRVGDDSGSVNAPVGLPAYGLLDASGAEFQLVVHHHGPKIPEYMPDMIETVAGGCVNAGFGASPWDDYEGPEYGRRGPNTCSSVQFSMHPPKGDHDD